MASLPEDANISAPIAMPMTKRRTLTLLPSLILSGFIATTVLADVPTAIEAVTTNGQMQARLSWAAEADRHYDILTTTNLASGDWWLAAPAPITPTNLIGEFQHPFTNRTQFFRVAQRDIRGPEITQRYPATNGIGVGRAAALSVVVTDESGVDTNRFVLTFNGVPLTNGSPGVTVTANRFQYVPGANTWGSYGATSVVSFVCADLLGNTTLASWTFTLEVEPVFTNVLLHLPPPPSGQRAILAVAAEQHGASFLEGLTIVAFETNDIVFSYTGAGHGLYVGAILVSHDPDRFFYRLVTSLAEDLPNQTVTAYTTDVPLTALIKDGTFSPELFIQGEGVRPAFGAPIELNYSIPISYESAFTVLPLEFDLDGDEVEDLRITPGALSLDLQGNVQLSCVIKDWRVRAIDASIETQLAAEIRAKVEFFAELAEFSETKTIANAPPVRVLGFVGPVPVWVDLRLGVDLGFQVSAEGAVVVEAGLDAYASSDFRLAWRPGNFEHSYNGSFDFVPFAADAGFELSAEAFVYLKPRLSVLVYGLAGVSVDFRRGPALEAVYEVGEPQTEITLYDKWSINADLTVVGVDDGELPDVKLVEEKRTMQTWYWPEIIEQSPEFTRHPSGVTAAAGSTVTLQASATGNPEPTYQWFQNGMGIPFQIQPTLTFTMGSGAAGSYHAIARNRLGWVQSNPATVSLLPALSEPGMVWIPCGTFTMGSPDNEPARYSWEGPQTRVTISHGFWMGRYEVTQGEYLAVMGSNPSYFIGDLNRPVEQVSWFDAVAYCTALTTREQNAGRLPAGYVYRLPTEAEWEYACRAGTTTPLHFGNELRSGMANFNGHSEYLVGDPYHSNPSGIYLNRTTAVGSYAPNAWGLYDMHGNVWEWCSDWWSANLPGGSVTDPQGPSLGSSERVIRSGAWDAEAHDCRSALRYGNFPAGRYTHDGFRVVLASSQQ